MKKKILFVSLALSVFGCGKSYEDLLQSGIELRGAQKWHEAKNALFAAAEKKQTAEVYKELGNVFLVGDQNIVEAEGYYKKALAVDPGYVDAQYNMGIVHVKKYEQTLDDYGKGNDALLAEADTWFKKVYSQNSNYAKAME